MNLDFLSSIKVKNVCATLLSGTTVCGLTAVYGTKIYENGTCLGLTYLGISACAVDSVKLNNKLPSYYLNTGSTALCATTAGNALALCGCIPSCFLGATATAVCATCAIGAKNLCGCVPASFLLSGGTAVCATCAGNASTVAGCTPSCFLGVTACACDSKCLGGQLPAYYMSATGGLTGATNGLGTTGQKVCLGGALIAGTSITGNYALCLGTVASKLSTVDLHSVGNTTIVVGALLMSSSGATFTDLTLTTKQGIKYASDYSLTYDPRSLVDKGYVDSVATGLKVYTAVCAATTGAITLSGNQTIDGFATATGNRILVKNQVAGQDNGIYTANSSAWSRASDYTGSTQVSNGDLIPVTSGSTQNSSIWALTTPDPIIVGTTVLTFTEFSTVIDVTAGQGIAITQVGGIHTVCVLLGANCGLSLAGTGLCVNSNIAGSCLSYSSGVLNVCASCFLGATACAADSAKLNNQSASYYAPIASPAFTTCITTPIACVSSCIRSSLISGGTISGLTAVYGTKIYENGTCLASTYLGINACACDSKCLGGHLPAYYLLSGGTALCATCAGNSACLGGVLPAGYLLSGSTAKNSLCLGGNLANTYAPLASPNFTTCTCAPIVCATTCVKTPIIQLTSVVAKGAETAIAYINGVGCITSGTTVAGFSWMGTTASGVGTYISATCICSNPNMTFDGTKLNITGNIYASSCVRSPLISGNTVCATTCFMGSGAGLTGIATSLKANDSSCLNGILPAGYLLSGGTAVCATCSVSSKALCGCIPSCFLGATATAVCATCAISAKALCGCVPASFLLSGGTAICATTAGNALCLGGNLANTYAPLASPNFTTCTCAPIVCATTCFKGSGAGLTGTAASLKSNDSSCLNGILPAGYLLSGGTAVCAICATTAGNALCLGGNLANTFAPLASPFLTGTIDTDTIRVGYCNVGKSLNIYDGANPNWHVLKLSANATGGTICVTRNGGTSSALSFANESGEIMRIDNNNYVSFGGCSTPAQMIDVCGGIVASTNICAVKFLENGTCLANTYATILSPIFCCSVNLKSGGSDSIPNLAVGCTCGELWGGSSTSDRGFLRLSAGGGSTLSAKVAIDLQGYSSSGCCYSELIRFLTAGNNVRMTITCGGNVAFGTCPNPSAVVDVCGGVKATSSICAGTCVCGGCVYGSTCVCGAIVCSNTCLLAGTCVTGTIACFSTSVRSPIISGNTCATATLVCGACGLFTTCACSPTVIGSTCVCGGVVCATTVGTAACTVGTTCICSPVGLFSTSSCSPVHCGACGYFATIVCSPTITGSTKICSPIVVGTSCVCGGVVCATTVGTAACTIGTTCVCSPIVLGSTCVCGACLCAGTCAIIANNTLITATSNPYIALCKSNATAHLWYLQASADVVGLGCTLANSFCVDTSGNAVTTGNIKGAIICATTCGTGPDWIATSDCRLKRCVKPIMGALSTVMQLNGVYYELCDDEKHENKIGLIAQDVQPILPQIVSHISSNENDFKYGITDDKLGISYGRITSILIEAIKELNKKVIKLEQDLNYYKNYNS